MADGVGADCWITTASGAPPAGGGFSVRLALLPGVVSVTAGFASSETVVRSQLRE